MTIENLAYERLTHGYDKNGINWEDAMDSARYTINRMNNVELLELISDMVELRLEAYSLEKEST